MKVSDQDRDLNKERKSACKGSGMGVTCWRRRSSRSEAESRGGTIEELGRASQDAQYAGPGRP